MRIDHDVSSLHTRLEQYLFVALINALFLSKCLTYVYRHKPYILTTYVLAILLRINHFHIPRSTWRLIAIWIKGWQNMAVITASIRIPHSHKIRPRALIGLFDTCLISSRKFSMRWFSTNGDYGRLMKQ